MSNNNTHYDCIHKYFETHAAQTPENVALLYKNREITYQELNQRANQLAHYLIQQGIGPETVVGICIERSPEFVVGLLGILKAGGAYISLEPTDPAERFNTILTDADATFLLTLKQSIPDIDLNHLQHIYLDTLTLVTESEENPEVPNLTSETLAYINYTSGSTGKPKGAQIPHRSVGGYMFDITYAQYDANQTFLQHSATAWDALTLELWTPLMNGARCVLYPERIPTPEELSHTIQTSGVTTLWLTSSLFNFLIDTDPQILSNVKQLLVGGEALSVPHIRRALESLPNTQLVNGYGPSECTVFSCCHPIDTVPEEAHAIPIGRPIGDRAVYLLDKHMNRAPIGVAGEIYIGGPAVTRGYVDRPRLTAETIIPNPFSQEPGAVMYKTGDLARYLPDGTIEFVGRDDDQIKLRGFRIELGEIEKALHTHPHIQNAIVLPRDDGPGNNKHLVAYIIPEANSRSPLHKLPNNMPIYDSNRSETYWMYRNIFLERHYWSHNLSLPENACVLDIGANIGLFTLFIHQLCATAQTYAFEPVPTTFETLQKNIDLYGLNTKTFKHGLSYESAQIDITYYPNSPALSGLYAEKAVEKTIVQAVKEQLQENTDIPSQYADEFGQENLFETKKIKIDLYPLSDIIRDNNIEHIDLLKIVVEKSELDVLQGIDEQDWQKISQIVTYVRSSVERLNEVVTLLEQQGYQVTIQQTVEKDENTHEGIHLIYAIAPERVRPAIVHSDIHAPQPIQPISPTKGLTTTETRAYLQEKLPDYMVPSTFVTLDTFPLTITGKIDRQNLPAPDWGNIATEAKFVAPRTETERQLAEIWSNLLGLDQVSIHDNFFELGGDSILAIQVVGKANIAGFQLTPKEVFQHQTIAQLAAVVDAVSVIPMEQGPVVGEVPLTPIQKWFFEQNLPNPHHWNQTRLIEVPVLSVDALKETTNHLLRHHDALRARFIKADDGTWQQFNADIDENNIPFICIDLSSVPPSEQSEAITAESQKLQTSLNLSDGPLFCMAYFNLGHEKIARLLIIVHHLVIDGISWRILLEDFQTIYSQIQEGKATKLPAKTTAFKHWAEQLTAYAQSNTPQAHLPHWLDDGWLDFSLNNMPIDNLMGLDNNIRASTHTIIKTLGSDETQSLLQEVPKAYNTRINDILLTALAIAWEEWGELPLLLLDLESHGRTDLFEGVDLSRTIGWFTSLFPVILRLDDTSDLGNTIKSIKEQLHQVSDQVGFSYGLLRYLNPEIGIALPQPQPKISFNYLGQFEHDIPAPFRIAAESTGPSHDPNGHRTHFIDINGSIVAGQLRMMWTYSTNVHEETSIETFAQSYMDTLKQLIQHCLSTTEQAYTPSDFGLASLDQEQLDRIIQKRAGRS